MTGLPNVAISVMQPWAWLIVHGWKDIENRTWRRAFTGPILIHAGKKVDQDAHHALMEGYHPATGGEPNWDMITAYRAAHAAGQVHTGGIVGVATITGCVDDHDSDWFVGDYGFTLTDARPLDFMPYKGALSLFPATYVQP